MISIRNRHIGFDDTWLVLIGIPVVAAMMSLMMFGAEYLDRPVLLLTYCIPVSLIFTTVFWLTFRWILILYRKRFPVVSQARMRIILEVITIIVAHMVIKVLLTTPVHALFGDPMGEHTLDSKNLTGSSLIVTLMIVAIYEGMYFYSLLQRTEMEKAQLEKANAESQLEGLRSHVNPHFLFNSLNTLAQLIREDAPKAESYVQKMSSVYRYILEMREKKLIPLREELRFLEAYLFLLNERFGDKVRVDLSISADAREKHLVPLALQLLIENAIKHNVASMERPLTISIFSHGEHALIVRNALQRKNVPVESTGFGLPNIQARYAYYTDTPVDIIATHDSFLVTLPLLSVPEEQLSPV